MIKLIGKYILFLCIFFLCCYNNVFADKNDYNCSIASEKIYQGSQYLSVLDYIDETKYIYSYSRGEEKIIGIVNNDSENIINYLGILESYSSIINDEYNFIGFYTIDRLEKKGYIYINHFGKNLTKTLSGSVTLMMQYKDGVIYRTSDDTTNIEYLYYWNIDTDEQEILTTNRPSYSSPVNYIKKLAVSIDKQNYAYAIGSQVYLNNIPYANVGNTVQSLVFSQDGSELSISTAYGKTCRIYKGKQLYNSYTIQKYNFCSATDIVYTDDNNIFYILGGVGFYGKNKIIDHEDSNTYIIEQSGENTSDGVYFSSSIKQSTLIDGFDFQGNRLRDFEEINNTVLTVKGKVVNQDLVHINKGVLYKNNDIIFDDSSVKVQQFTILDNKDLDFIGTQGTQINTYKCDFLGLEEEKDNSILIENIEKKESLESIESFENTEVKDDNIQTQGLDTAEINNKNSILEKIRERNKVNNESEGITGNKTIENKEIEAGKVITINKENEQTSTLEVILYDDIFNVNTEINKDKDKVQMTNLRNGFDTLMFVAGNIALVLFGTLLYYFINGKAKIKKEMKNKNLLYDVMGNLVGDKGTMKNGSVHSSNIEITKNNFPEEINDDNFFGTELYNTPKKDSLIKNHDGEFLIKKNIKGKVPTSTNIKKEEEKTYSINNKKIKSKDSGSSSLFEKNDFFK